MKLSVAMCTYNGARYLQEQLESIAAQTRLPDELVVCDDCSSDGTRAILEEFKARVTFPVRLYFNEQNLRVWKNFEKAISLCEGEVIALCDQDDVWLPEKLGRMEEAFAATPDAGVVFSDLEVVDENLRPLGYRAWQSSWVEFGEPEQRLFRQGKALQVLITHNVVTGAAMAFRAKYKDLVLPLPEFVDWLIHDYWIVMLIAAVARVTYIKTPLVKYRIHAEQSIGLLPPDTSRVFPEKFTLQNRNFKHPVQYRRAELLLERFLEKNEPQYGAAIADLKARLRHGQMQERLADQKFASRVLRIHCELVAGRYHLCAHPESNGWRDAAIDLLPYKFK